ncbi:hypothetical protein Hdeb2414_s0025g00659011 [Helianthus debilis subsp. tardiflorus]
MATSGDLNSTNVPYLSPIKLTSTNYLVWRNHMKLLVAHHKLSAYIDGSSDPPPATVKVDDKTTPNPDFATWTASD